MAVNSANINGFVAQTEERYPEKVCVDGSIPSETTKINGLMTRASGLLCKQHQWGSLPHRSTKQRSVLVSKHSEIISTTEWFDSTTPHPKFCLDIASSLSYNNTLLRKT